MFTSLDFLSCPLGILSFVVHIATASHLLVIVRAKRRKCHCSGSRGRHKELWRLEGLECTPTCLGCK